MKLNRKQLKEFIENTLNELLIEEEGDESSFEKMMAGSEGEEKAKADVVPEEADVLAGSIDEQMDEYFAKYETSATKDSQIDGTKFAVSVSRMIRNYDNVLDIKGAIKARAISYAMSNFPEEVATKVKDSLNKLTMRPIDYDKIVPPAAKNSGPTIE